MTEEDAKKPDDGQKPPEPAAAEACPESSSAPVPPQPPAQQPAQATEVPAHSAELPSVGGSAQPEAPPAPVSGSAKPSEEPTPKAAKRFKCLVTYGKMFQQAWFLSFFDSGLGRFAKVVVKTSRGTELGKVVLGPQPIPENEDAGTEGRILRVAVPEDLARARHIEDVDEPRELDVCDQRIEQHRLDMDLVEVEHLFGGEKIIFYFMADRRVDFRALVRDLAREFHTRIELRQIGVRDKAKLLSDYEHCGLGLCCRTFLRELAPVGMRMAKVQRTTLDPGKISGCCGRLMCCLRFEDDTYRWLLSQMPRRGSIATYEGERYRIVDLDPIGDRLVLVREDGSRVIVKRDMVAVADAAPGGAGVEVAPAEDEPGADVGETSPQETEEERLPAAEEAAPDDAAPNAEPSAQSPEAAAPPAAEAQPPMPTRQRVEAAPQRAEAAPPSVQTPAGAASQAAPPGNRWESRRRRRRRRFRQDGGRT